MRIQRSYKPLPSHPSKESFAGTSSLDGYEQITPSQEVELLRITSYCNQRRDQDGRILPEDNEQFESAVSWLVAGNYGLLRVIAEKHRTDYITLDDALSTAIIGMWDTIRRFDIDTSVQMIKERKLAEDGQANEPTPLDIHKSFIAYLKKCVLGEFAYLHDEETTTRIPRHRQHEIRTWRKGQGSLSILGRTASAHLKYESTDPSVRLEGAVDLDSLVAFGRQAAVDILQSTDYEDDPHRVVEEDQLAEAIESALEDLTEKEAEIIRLRFGLGSDQPLSKEEIAGMYGVTPERIRQIEAATLSKLRHPIRTGKLRGFIGKDNLEAEWRRADQAKEQYKKDQLRALRINKQLKPIERRAVEHEEQKELHALLNGLSLLKGPELVKLITGLETIKELLTEDIIEQQREEVREHLTSLLEPSEWSIESDRLAKNASYWSTDPQLGNFHKGLNSELMTVTKIQDRLFMEAKIQGENFNRSNISWLIELSKLAADNGWFNIRMALAHRLYVEKDPVD